MKIKRLFDSDELSGLLNQLRSYNYQTG